jgi:hypothetical protein
MVWCTEVSRILQNIQCKKLMLIFLQLKKCIISVMNHIVL